jgi:hypothetical protein
LTPKQLHGIQFPLVEYLIIYLIISLFRFFSAQPLQAIIYKSRLLTLTRLPGVHTGPVKREDKIRWGRDRTHPALGTKMYWQIDSINSINLFYLA